MATSIAIRRPHCSTKPPASPRRSRSTTDGSIVAWSGSRHAGERLMADLAISYVALADLAPYPKNARTHSPEQVAQIAASIREYGFTNPILTDEQNSVIAGHGRL